MSARKEALARIQKAETELRQARNYDATKKAQRHLVSAQRSLDKATWDFRSKLEYCIQMGTMTDQHVMGLLDATESDIAAAREMLNPPPDTSTEQQNRTRMSPGG